MRGGERRRLGTVIEATNSGISMLTPLNNKFKINLIKALLYN